MRSLKGRVFVWLIILCLSQLPTFAADLSLLYDGCTVRVPAQVGSRTAYLIFDTGSTVSALDRSTYAAQLGNPVAEVRASSIGGLTNFALYRCPEILIGNMAALLGRIAAVDLSRIDAISGSECDGILGADFAQQHVISMNFDAHLFEVEKEGEDEQPGGAVRLPLKTIGNGNVALDATVEGVPVTFMIDTGDNGSISLNAEDWRRVTQSHSTSDIHTILTAPISGEPMRSSAVRINDLNVGPNHYRGFIASALPNPNAPSTLGLRFLRQHAVRFDFQKRELFLRSGAAFGERETFDMSGLHLVRSGGDTIVYAVDEGSPADRVGIHPGDAVETINNVAATQMTMRDIRRTLKSNDGATVFLDVRHGTEIDQWRLRLRKTL